MREEGHKDQEGDWEEEGRFSWIMKLDVGFRVMVEEGYQVEEGRFSWSCMVDDTEVFY